MHDGVGVVCQGNLAVILYAADARLHRTCWVFDRMDELAARNPDGIYALMIITPQSGPPDGATRTENATRLRQLDQALIAMVTVALGDSFKLNIVRTVMRTMFLLSRKGARHVVCSTEREGMERLLEATKLDPRVPTRADIEADLAALHAPVKPHAA